MVRVLNGRSSLMVEIRLTGQSWLLELTGPGSVRLGGLGKKRAIGLASVSGLSAKIAAEQKLLSHTALERFSLIHLPPHLSSPVIYFGLLRTLVMVFSIDQLIR